MIGKITKAALIDVVIYLILSLAIFAIYPNFDIWTFFFGWQLKGLYQIINHKP